MGSAPKRLKYHLTSVALATKTLTSARTERVARYVCHQKNGILIFPLVPGEGQVTLDPDVKCPAPFCRDDMVVELVGTRRQGRPGRLLLSRLPLGLCLFIAAHFESRVTKKK